MRVLCGERLRPVLSTGTLFYKNSEKGQRQGTWLEYVACVEETHDVAAVIMQKRGCLHHERRYTRDICCFLIQYTVS